MPRPNAPILRAARRRLASRWLALILFISLLWFAWVSPKAQAVAVSLSPFIVLSSAIATRTVSLVSLAGLPFLLLILLSRRCFCRYACPLGLMQDLCHLTRRNRTARWSRLPRLGQFAFLATLAGASLGLPLFLWADPLAIFAALGALGHWPVKYAAVAAASLGLLILLLAMLAPHLWCARLCPLGGMQELLYDLLRRLRLRKTTRDSSNLPSPQHAWSRRVLLGAGFGAAGALALKAAGAPPKKVLRPPGAASPGQFEWLCVRCGNCIRACPYVILHNDFGQSGPTGILTPVLTFNNDYCRPDCVACGQACPSGALQRLTVGQKPTTRIGLARVNLDTCDMAKGGDCRRCIHECPYHAIEPAGDDFDPFPRVLADPCTGCGACQRVCPVTPPAILIS